MQLYVEKLNERSTRMDSKISLTGRKVERVEDLKYLRSIRRKFGSLERVKMSRKLSGPCKQNYIKGTKLSYYIISVR